MPQRSTIDPREKQLNVPKRHKVAIFREQGGPITIEDADVVHDLPRGQALVRVIYSGVCHTDLHANLGAY
jgi:propanol-preferring alcohol dehydrogenase